VDGNGCRDRCDGTGEGVDGVPVARGVSWELDLCLGRDDKGGDAETEWRAAVARRVGAKSGREMVEFLPGAGAVIFTDDRAPIEEMTRRMLLESKKT
jgi:hypothetical protein